MLIKKRGQLAASLRENLVPAVAINLEQFLNLVSYNEQYQNVNLNMSNCPILHYYRNNADLGANCKTRFNKNKPIHDSCQSLN